MRYLKIISLLLASCFLLFASMAYAQDIAIIVHKENKTEAVSFKDLVKIFRQERQYWADGKKIYLILQERGSPEKEVILKKVYKMTDIELKKLWLMKMFREEIASFPKTLGSNKAVKHFVSQVPNAIGFIDADFVDESIKVLRIDGKLPQDKNYPLSAVSHQ